MFAELCARLGRPPKALFTAACGLLEGVLRYMGQHNLLQSDMRLASFDDHLIEGETPEPIQRKLDATLQRRYKAVE
ncbi:LacI family transcriptional regulator [Enterobacter cloacae]|nr:LacI family transcriptional regulator [Enterobacter cloacae]